MIQMEIIMQELLTKLLEAEILTPETTAELTAAYTKQFEATVVEAKLETEKEVRAELTEQWISEREVLIEAIDSKVTQYLVTEMADLKDDIESFRDLETEFAEKLVEAKALMSTELQTDLAKLIENMDGFLERRLSIEFQELREDIQEVKKNEFGRALYEAFNNEFTTNFIDEESIQAKLHESQAQLTESRRQVTRLRKTSDSLNRKSVMGDLLAPLNEYHQEVMGSILQTVPTNKLSETYDKFIGRIVKESKSVDTSEKEAKVLAEGEQSGEVDSTKSLVLKNGDAVETLAEQHTKAANMLSESDRASLRKLSGIS